MSDSRPHEDILRQLCDEFHEDDGVDPREFVKRGVRRKTTSRDHQLCAQVKRCLDLELPGQLLRRDVSGAEVHSVTPAPDSSRLAVVVAVAAQDIASAQQAIQHASTALREGVAGAIHRKGVPELVFEVVPADWEDDG